MIRLVIGGHKCESCHFGKTQKVKRFQSAVYRHSAALTRQTGSMAADDVAAGAASPHRSALGRAQSLGESVEMAIPDSTACQVSPRLAASKPLLLSHMNILTKAQQPFTDYKKAVNVLASLRGCVELKRLLPSNKRDDCLRVIKRLLGNLEDDDAIKDTLRVLDSLQYDKTQLRASRLGPVLQTLSGHGAEAVAAEALQVLQQFQDVPRSAFGRRWYLSEECQAL